MTDEGDETMPETGAVFTFGRSRFAENEPNRFWIRDDPVSVVACGDEHTVFATRSGRLFTFGVNNFGQLGHANKKTYTKPTCVKALKGNSVLLVACGKNHSLVYCESGHVFAFGCNVDYQCTGANIDSFAEPEAIEELCGLNIKQLTATAQGSVALTENGSVMLWGTFGAGKNEHVFRAPEQLHIQTAIKRVSCGYYQVALLTASGSIFLLFHWGETEDEVIFSMNPVEADLPEPVAQVSCGSGHMAAVTDTGKVYTWGQGSSGQLGQGTRCTTLSKPKLCSDAILNNVSIETVECGENHTALVSDSRQVYVFGNNQHGKLGVDASWQCEFTPQRLEKFSRFDVMDVACGGCHMLVVAKPCDGWRSREETLQKNNHRGDDNNENEFDIDVVDVFPEATPISITKSNGLTSATHLVPAPIGSSARDRRRSAETNNSEPYKTSVLPPISGLLSSKTLPPISLPTPSIEKNNARRDNENILDLDNSENEEEEHAKATETIQPRRPSQASPQKPRRSFSNQNQANEDAENQLLFMKKKAPPIAVSAASVTTVRPKSQNENNTTKNNNNEEDYISNSEAEEENIDDEEDIDELDKRKQRYARKQDGWDGSADENDEREAALRRIDAALKSTIAVPAADIDADAKEDPQNEQQKNGHHLSVRNGHRSSGGEEADKMNKRPWSAGIKGYFGRKAKKPENDEDVADTEKALEANKDANSANGTSDKNDQKPSVEAKTVKTRTCAVL